MLCLRCGQKEQRSDNLCEECLLADLRMVSVPPVVLASYCPTCNKVLRNRSWSETKWDIGESALEAARDAIAVNPEVSSLRMELDIASQDIRLFKVLIRVSGVYKGLLVDREHGTEVRLTPLQCPFCSKQSGSYYEATLQVRGTEMLSEEEREELLQKVREELGRMGQKDPNVFITKEETVKGGYDFMLGHGGSARQLAQRLHEIYGGDQKTSSTLFGRKEGREVYRMTHLVRLPGFLVGDYLLRGREPFKVLKSGKRVTLRSLKGRHEMTLTVQEAMGMKVLRRFEVESELVVVNQTRTELQVLHPATYETVDLVKYEGFDPSSKVLGALIEGELYLV